MLAYKFPLCPNQEQERKMLWTKEVHRKTYNRLLEEHNKGEHDRLKLQALLPIWKEEDKELKGVNSKVLQYEVYRRSYNQKGLDEKRKRGKKAGKLRWKPPQRFRSFTYNQSGFGLRPKREKWGTLHPRR